MAAALMLTLLILAMTGHSSATWCVCKDGGDGILQKTLDYACGNGADCNPIKSNGPCFNPNTVRAHCSYAVNSYFQKKGQAQGSCDFSGTASITTTDPSSTGCSYPSSGSSSGTSTTPTTPGTSTTPTNSGTSTTPTSPGTSTNPSTTPTTMNPSTNTPTSTTPYGSTTPTGVLGGAGTGLGPSGMGNTNTDYSDGGFRVQAICSFASLMFAGLILFWG